MQGSVAQENKYMAEYESGAIRHTGGKGRMDLIPWCAIMRVSRHMEEALDEYPERNWENGLPMHTMVDSAFRHLAKYVDGWTDEDHLCAAATNLLMAMWTEEKRPEMQDMPTGGSPLASLGLEHTNTDVSPPDIAENERRAKERLREYAREHRVGRQR